MQCLPELVEIDRLTPAVYNPREADGFRLNFLRISLTHLGFVLPLYATRAGHVLSGHQRLRVAKELGCTHVPVVWVDVPEKHWRTLNLLFNRVTNDMDSDENSEMYLNDLGELDMDEALKLVPPKKVNTPEFYPCMRCVDVPFTNIMHMTTRVYSSHAAGTAERLHRFDINMPLLANEKTGKIINGNFRAFGAMEHNTKRKKGHTSFPVVYLTDAEAHIAEALVNLISMKFTIEKQFGDLLRYGGYRRPTNKVEDLVIALRFWADGKKRMSASQSLEEPERFWHNWRQEHGDVVADMGAGQRRNGLILRKKGIKCVDWEPYPCDWMRETEDPADRPSLQLSRRICGSFLDEIEAGTKFDSIFANAVINSIPFHKDRMCFFALCHAMSSFHTGFYGTAKCINGFKTKDFIPLNRINEQGRISHGAQQSKFQVPYEAGVLLADISRAPKVQKYHTPEGLRQMLSVFYSEVHVYFQSAGNYQFFEAKKPKRVSPKVLREALEMEFNLPYPNNERIGLVDRALEVFSKRIGVDLRDPKYAPEPKDAAA